VDSPLLEPRTCPTCPGLIAGADRLCFQCLGPDHAEDGLNQSPTCNACRMIPQLNRRHRGDLFRVKFGPPEEAEDQDLKVVEMGEQDDEVPFVFTIPRGRVATVTEEEDDEDASLSGTFGPAARRVQHRSARLDFPAVMTLVVERVGLPLPPPLPLRPVSRLRQGFYGPVHPAQPAFVSPPVPDVWQYVEATWRQPLRTKAPIAAMAGIIRIQGARPLGHGVSRYAPLDESLTAHLPPQAAGWTEGRKPLAPLPRD